MLTGKPMEENVTFTRKLLSQYLVEFGLGNYIRYFDMKNVITEIEDVYKKKEKEKQKQKEKRQKQKQHQQQQMQQQQQETGATATTTTGATATTTAAEDNKMQEESNAELHQQTAVTAKKFFDLLNESYKAVNAFASERDKQILASIRHIQSLSTPQIVASPNILENAYTDIRNLANYRDLNCEALRKIMKKFIERVCIKWGNHSLQEKILHLDKIIVRSSISEAPYDISEYMDYVISAHALCNKCSFEQSTQHLVRHVNSVLETRPRIAPISSAYFFQQRMPHRFAQGSFAVRIVPGNSNPKLAKIIGQVMQGKFAAKSSVSQFANGEVSVEINEAVRGDDCFIVQSITNVGEQDGDDAGDDGKNKKKVVSASTILVELLLLLQTARLASCARMTAVIPYFAYTSSPVDAAAIAEMIVKMGCCHVITVDMPNAQVEGFFGNVPVENLTARFEFIRFLAENLRSEEHDFSNIVCVAPTGDAVHNTRKFADSLTKYVVKLNLHAASATSTRGGKAPGQTSPLRRGSGPYFAGRHSPDGAIAQSLAVATTTPKALDAELAEKLKQQQQQQLQQQHPQPFCVGVATAVERAATEPRATFSSSSPSSVVEIIGHVGPESLCIITAHVIDDVAALLRVSEKLASLGCKRIKLVGTHAIFSESHETVQRLAAAPIEEILITDSINRDSLLYHAALARKMRILPVGPLLAEAIQRIHTGNSLSTLFEK